jgi:hypothetical protein
MADAPKKGLALLLLGGKKPTKDEPEAEAEDASEEARKAAAQGILDALADKDVDALDEALGAWMDAR